MKKIFASDDLLVNRGSHIESPLAELYSYYNRDVTIVEILEKGTIFLYDKLWILYNTCDLTLKQKVELACILEKAVAPTFNEKCTETNSGDDLWQAIKDFKKKLITEEQLLKIKKGAEDNFTVMYVINTAYHAAFAVYYMDLNVRPSAAADYAENATYYAIATAFGNEDPTYTNLLNQLMIDFVNEQN